MALTTVPSSFSPRPLLFFPFSKPTTISNPLLLRPPCAAAADGALPLQATTNFSPSLLSSLSLASPTVPKQRESLVPQKPNGIQNLTLLPELKILGMPSIHKFISRVTLSELLQNSKIVPLSVCRDLSAHITGIQHDSREVVTGDLFICRFGSKAVGRDYLAEAISRGAVAVIADRELRKDETFRFRATVTVEDTNSVIPLLAAAFYGRPSEKLSVIGITGTNGKTTATCLIKSLYEALGSRIGMLGTIGYYIHGDHQLEAPNTTPDALVLQKLMAEMVYNGTKAVVMEASSHGLALGRCNEIDFDVAVFTNLTRDHLDFHGTMDEYRKSKGKLFDRMLNPKKHRKVVNLDDPNAYYFIAKGNPEVPLVTFGMENKDAHVWPLDLELSLLRTRVLVGTPKGAVEICSKLIGRYNVYNILSAVAVGIAVDAPLEAIVRGIEQMEGVPGRCELIDEKQDFAVIVDYAHTPDALSRLLDAARELEPKRIITVFGCGGERDRGKRPLMTKIAAEKSDLVFLTSDNPRNEDPMDILDDMLGGVGWTINDYLKFGASDCYPPLPNHHRIFVHEIRRVALQAAIAMGKEGDIVVVAGKGHETYQIEGDKKKFFDDREECRDALQSVKKLQQDGIHISEFPWWYTFFFLTEFIWRLALLSVNHAMFQACRTNGSLCEH